MVEGVLKDFKYGETSEKTFRIKDGKAHILQAKLLRMEMCIGCCLTHCTEKKKSKLPRR